MKKIYIYESSSKGGCFVYAQYLADAFVKNGNYVELIIPKNSELVSSHQYVCKYLLINDRTERYWKYLARFHFLYRQIVNPLIFLCYLFRKNSCSIVIWNDFEQLSAPLWTLLLPVLAGNHQHQIVLHDPDRDAYPPHPIYAKWTMKCIMKRMHVGLYHGYLPDKSYYKLSSTLFKEIPHGIYRLPLPDKEIETIVQSLRVHHKSIWLALGNIRFEKNYDTLLQVIKKFPDVKLIIAGSKSSSSVEYDVLKKEAEHLSVENQIYWDIRYLTEAQMAAYLNGADWVWLNYKDTFTSQSGILNLLVPYRKKFVYNKGYSSLAIVCNRFGLGTPSSSSNIVQIVEDIRSNEEVEISEVNWLLYEKEMAWSKIVEVMNQSNAIN
jgi:glycosyltransferase involved in cell wall biosynthesis